MKLGSITCAAAVLALAGCVAAPQPNRAVQVQGSPPAQGPYSPVVVAGNLVFTAGVIARDPAGTFVGGDITTQATRVFDNVTAQLASAGATWDDVAKVTVYLTNIADAAKMSEVMASRVGMVKPARTTVGVAALPAGALIEVDVIAVKQPR